MKTLTERLNFSNKKETIYAVMVEKYGNNDFYNLLETYCSRNNIHYSNDDLDDAVEVIIDYGINDDIIESYYFWID